MTWLGGGLVAAVVLSPLLEDGADAARRKRRGRGRALIVQTVNVDQRAGVKANEVIEVRFSAAVDPRSVNPAVVRIREENADRTGFTRQIPADFQVAGNFLRVFPRLPTHLRDPDSPDRAFYPLGSPRDDALENAALQPGRRYELTILGHPTSSPVRSRAGKRLRRSFTTRFSVDSSSDPSRLYTANTYSDTPPPEVVFSNPADRTPAVLDQYTAVGGAVGVPTATRIALVNTKVPLSPSTLRAPGNVELTLIARRGDSSARRPLAATPFVEQNFETSLIVVDPSFALPDVSTFALRLRKRVKDLTEEFDFQSNRERERLRQMYDELNLRRRLSPTKPVEELAGPAAALTPDWPRDEASRGVLRRNLLALGDGFPDEIDPTVVVLFTTRDEDVTEDELHYDFEKSEGLFDARLSTAEIDDAVPSAAYAIRTIAGGSAIDGNLNPEVDTTLSTDDPAFSDGIMNFRDVVIPEGVTVRITGSRPARLRAIRFRLDGTLDVSGFDGETGNATSASSISAVNHTVGGAGGPGGGAGADASRQHRRSSTVPVPAGSSGERAVDTSGDASGGFGGLGGRMATSTRQSYSGGGGGGGGAEAGQNGQGGRFTTAAWNGGGGNGGDAGIDAELEVLAGGGGGGSGGNGVSSNTRWNTWGYVSGSSGGGGAGAVEVQTAKTLVVGPAGQIVARGGDGGGVVFGGSRFGSGGPGGGGGGGAVRLRSGTSVLLESATTAVDVSGGAGGPGSTTGGTSTNYRGGDGGAGAVRVEDPLGGLTVPTTGAVTAGTFDPVGGGVPSFVYTKFADLGVAGARVLSPSTADIETHTIDDAIFVEMQLTRENPDEFGAPDLSMIDAATQDSLSEPVTSAWLPLKMHDNSGTPEGAIPVPGYDPVIHGPEYVFPVASDLHLRDYRFVRFRVTFQLDDAHSRRDPLPSVGELSLRFQFNF